MKLSNETLLFIEENKNEDVRKLALRGGKQDGVDLSAALTQIAGYQAAKEKLPTWSNTPGILYPRHLSMEQCSSETTARYKATLAARLLSTQPHPQKAINTKDTKFADLTGGFGIDCFFISTQFKASTYVEQQEELCDIATHNFALLQRNDITVCHADATEYLSQMASVDCLFIDPARRDTHGSKTVAIADCEPNVKALEELLLQKASTVIVKLSPMLDIAQALRDLHSIREVHVVSVQNECKELLLVLAKEVNTTPIEKSSVQLHCVNLIPHNNKASLFSFTPEEETKAVCNYVTMETLTNALANNSESHAAVGVTNSGESSQSLINHDQESTIANASETEGTTPPYYPLYLYEPNASILKAGGYRSLAQHYQLQKLHSNSHLYVSTRYIDHFPGRRFGIEKMHGFGKKELKELSQLKQANITIRNFPSTVNDLRKRLKLTDGGETYLFATTIADGHKAIFQCKKV